MMMTLGRGEKRAGERGGVVGRGVADTQGGRQAHRLVAMFARFISAR